MKTTTKLNLSNGQKIEAITQHMYGIMSALGLDLNDPSLKDTPRRVAKLYVSEIFAGLHLEAPKMTVFPNKNYDQMVLIRDITVNSCCEHHFLPFVGKCSIAYLPGKNVLGLSKFSRAVQHFAARPQLQERLTTDIGTFLQKVLKTKDVAVLVDCVHTCCSIRGAKDATSSTVTSFLGGKFKDTALRSEFLTLRK